MLTLFKRPWLILALALITLAAGWYYLSSRPPPGVDPMSGPDSAVAQLTALITALVSLAGTLLGLMMQFLDYRKRALEVKVKELDLATKQFELDQKRQSSHDG